MRLTFALLLSLVLVCGCTQSAVDEPPPREADLFGATAMRIHPIFTQIKDWSGSGKPDGVEVLLEFQDQFGDPTKAAGTAIFELFDYRQGDPEPRGQRLANPWIGSIVTSDEQRSRWNRTSRTYTFQLAYPQIDKTKSYVLTAEFRPITGGQFFDRVVLEGQEEPSATQPTTQPTHGLFGH